MSGEFDERQKNSDKEVVKEDVYKESHQGDNARSPEVGEGKEPDTDAPDGDE